eukprot:6188232-Pleurochrysis_carterae.AAC.2
MTSEVVEYDSASETIENDTTNEDADDEVNEGRGVERLRMLSERTGIALSTLFTIYEEQKSLCAVTGLPMEDTPSDTWYALECAKKVAYKPLDANNVCLVCSIVNIMKPDNMHWEAFRQFCSHISDNELEGFN